MAEGAVNLSAPQPVVAATPQAPVTIGATATPIMENGGQTSSGDGWGSFLKNTNWLQVGFMILGSYALLTVVRYYQIESQKNRLANNRLRKDIDEVKMNLQSQMKGKYKEIN